MEKCSWPVSKGEDVAPCNKRAVVVFQREGSRHPRCRIHATKAAYALAEATGWTAVAA